MLSFLCKRFFSDKKTCLQRSKLLAFSKSLLHRSIPLIQPHLFSYSLKFSSLFLSNLTAFGYPDSELFQTIKLNIKERTRELTHDLALRLLENLASRQVEDDGAILQDIHTYIQMNFHKFSYEEIKQVQRFYFFCDKTHKLPFSPLFNQNKEEFLERKLKVSLRQTTDEFLEASGLTFPKEMMVTVSNYRSKIVVRFLKSGQKLTLYGISHMDKKEILEMRRAVYKEKNTILYFFEKPPAEYLKYKNLQMIKKESPEPKGNKTSTFFFENLDYTHKQSTGKTPQNLLAEYGELSFLNKDYLDFYVQNFILQNHEEYELNGSQNLIYSSDWGLKKPNEIASLLYILALNKSTKAKENLVVFADISTLEEIQHFTAKKSNEELKTLYERLRLIWVNQLIFWLRRVNKVGCPICSKQNNFGPQDIYNSMGDQDFDYSFRETAMAYKIMKGLALNPDNKEAIGFFGSDHILELVKNMARMLEGDADWFEKNKDFKGGMEGINKELIWKKLDYKKMLEKDEFMEEQLSRWALLVSALSDKK